MDASDVRKQRLQQWLNDQFEGNVAAFCRYYKLKRSTASYISQIMGGARPFGERAARNLETQCNRPVGWLDVVPTPTADVQPLRYDPQMIAKLSVDSRELIEDFIEMVIRREEKPTSGGLSNRYTSAKLSAKPSSSIRAASRKPIGQSYSPDEQRSPAPESEKDREHC